MLQPLLYDIKCGVYNVPYKMLPKCLYSPLTLYNQIIYGIQLTYENNDRLHYIMYNTR